MLKIGIKQDFEAVDLLPMIRIYNCGHCTGTHFEIGWLFWAIGATVKV